MDKENRIYRSRGRMSADDRKRQLLSEVAEEALELLVEEGEMEKFFCPEDGKTHYRLRSAPGKETENS
jgi:hypothetical protein